MDDPYLNHYADRFILLGLGAHGVGLEQYLANPLGFEHLAEFEPPLPAQIEAAERIWARWAADDADLQVRGAA